MKTIVNSIEIFSAVTEVLKLGFQIVFLLACAIKLSFENFFLHLDTIKLGFESFFLLACIYGLQLGFMSFFSSFSDTIELGLQSILICANGGELRL